jgi:hypothetical protein
MLPGTAHIIIRGPGAGDSILRTLLISVGDLVGDMVQVGLVSDLDSVMVTDMDMGMDMDTMDVVGGVHLIIILLVGVAGMERRDLMDSTEIISTFTIMSM